ncbi:uncharacterized protein LOC133526031 [Cydia pomonella]|uniref:uncharacterized protein LOC133526031 n=1 Tax=Cydia pomonella TaxID=82600 RepID=UPI002ADE0A63|nr:uncharacterized protein LOC133526031 [Cydia pomonella]
MCNLPVLTKCCCCIPLRKGLIAWGYLRMILTAAYLLIIVHEVGTQFSAKGLAILLALLSFLVANMVFTITFVIGLHKKNYKLLRLYYSFSIFALIVVIMGYFIFITLQVALTLQDEEKYILGFPLIAVNISTVTSIFLDLYFLILIKIEILKQRNETAYYVNGARRETSFVLDVSMAKEQDRRYTSYSDSDSEEDAMEKKRMFPVHELEILKKDLENKRI